MILVPAMCESKGHAAREAVGRFAVVHLLAGPRTSYLCAECAHGRIPHDVDAARWILAHDSANLHRLRAAMLLDAAAPGGVDA